MDDIINNALNALHTNNQLMATRAELAAAQESYNLLNERVAKIVAEQQRIIAENDNISGHIGKLRQAGKAMRDAIVHGKVEALGADLTNEWDKLDNQIDTDNAS